MEFPDGVRARTPRRRARWTFGSLDAPAPTPAAAPAPTPPAAERVPAPATERPVAEAVAPELPPEPEPEPEPQPEAVTGPEPAPAPEPPVVTTTTTSEFDRAVPPGLQIAASWSWRVLLVVAVVVVLGWVAAYLSQVVVPIAIAVLLAALLAPVARALYEWGLPRGAATALTVLGGLTLIVGSLILIGTQIAAQAGTLSGNVVQSFNQLLDYLRHGPIPIPDTWLDSGSWAARVSDFLTDSQSVIAGYAAAIGTGAGQFLAGFAIALFALIYFLYDGRSIFLFLLKFVPRTARDRVDVAALKGWRSLSAFVRTTILVALVDAVGVLIIALVLRVPLAPALGALVFLGAFIPVVGGLLAGLVAVAVALVALGWVQALIMLGGVIVVLQVEAQLLQPFLLGRAVKLHPLAVLLAIAVGVISGGIVGALLAVPLLAFTKSFVQYLAGADEPRRLRPLWPVRRPVV